MSKVEFGFPIAGSDVSQVLGARFDAEASWEVHFMDIPSGATSPEELNALRANMETGTVTISNQALCHALTGAPQVWVLDIRLSSDNSVELHIEDGTVFASNLGPPRSV